MQTTRTLISRKSSASPPEPLASRRLEVDDDPLALYEQSLEHGWGDGLPLLPPTEYRVRQLIDATPYYAEDVICTLLPRNGIATVEKAAVNAAMAGCQPAAFPLVIAALEAIAVPEFNLFGLATTTSSVIPMLIVNGPRRIELGIDMMGGCMGGAAGRGSMTIGRAVCLCMRNIGGQRVGLTSKSVFGQPARSGLCFAEWEEESPWPSLAERRGFRPDDEVVTVHGGKGTVPLADIHNDDPRDLLALLAKSVAFPLGNMFLGPHAGHGEIVLAINPVWARRFAAVFPDIGELQNFLRDHAWQPIELWPPGNQRILEGQGRVDQHGRVFLAERPDQFVIVVCGGKGSLHTICLPSWGESQLQSR
ncbi:MAG TPA: hypothetical protein VLL25_05205, partial [Acidimicrobiales bacterium]|nr:hypothetical protein [Acidimicrobiales bacterium]